MRQCWSQEPAERPLVDVVLELVRSISDAQRPPSPGGADAPTDARARDGAVGTVGNRDASATRVATPASASSDESDVSSSSGPEVSDASKTSVAPEGSAPPGQPRPTPSRPAPPHPTRTHPATRPASPAPPTEV